MGQLDRGDQLARLKLRLDMRRISGQPMNPIEGKSSFAGCAAEMNRRIQCGEDNTHVRWMRCHTVRRRARMARHTVEPLDRIAALARLTFVAARRILAPAGGAHLCPKLAVAIFLAVWRVSTGLLLLRLFQIPIPSSSFRCEGLHLRDRLSWRITAEDCFSVRWNLPNAFVACPGRSRLVPPSRLLVTDYCPRNLSDT